MVCTPQRQSETKAQTDQSVYNDKSAGARGPKKRLMKGASEHTGGGDYLLRIAPSALGLDKSERTPTKTAVQARVIAYVVLESD